MKKLLLIILVLLFAVTAYAETGTNTVTYWIRNGEATYDATRNDGSGSNDSSSGPKVGQQAGYVVHRGYAHFTIPALGSCTSAYLYLYGDADVSTTDFEIMAYLGLWADNPSSAKWDQFQGWQASGVYNGTTFIDVGEWSTASGITGWNVIELNADGRAAILTAQGDTLKIAFISKEDVNYDAPAGDEYVSFEGFGSAFAPYLRINDPIGGGGTVSLSGVSMVGVSVR